MIRTSFDTLGKAYAKLFNLALTVGEVPNIWCKGLITPVFKNGDAFNPENYRPICVLSCLCKFFTNALNIRLSESTKRCKIIDHVQIGFSENHRTTDHIFTLKSIIFKNVSNSTRGKVYSCFVDFKKAFDTVWHEGLFQKLLEVNGKGNFLKLIQSLYKKWTCAVKINNCRTDFFSCKKGVRQGCPISPILFNLYINDLLNDLNEYSFDSVHLSAKLQITWLAYADDIILISKSALGLQNLLNCLHKFCEKWKVKVNQN